MGIAEKTYIVKKTADWRNHSRRIAIVFVYKFTQTLTHDFSNQRVFLRVNVFSAVATIMKSYARSLAVFKHRKYGKGRGRESAYCILGYDKSS